MVSQQNRDYNSKIRPHFAVVLFFTGCRWSHKRRFYLDWTSGSGLTLKLNCSNCIIGDRQHFLETAGGEWMAGTGRSSSTPTAYTGTQRQTANGKHCKKRSIHNNSRLALSHRTFRQKLRALRSCLRRSCPKIVPLLREYSHWCRNELEDRYFRRFRRRLLQNKKCL